MARNPNIDDDTRARAMKFVAQKAAPKPRVVSKKELDASGLSLRDFLNKERGLTRRKEVDPTAGEAKDRKAQEAADRIDPGKEDAGGRAKVLRQNAEIKSRTGLSPTEYVRSGKSAVDIQDDEAAEMAKKAKAMSAYKPRGSSTLSDVVKPGTATNYENKDTEDMTYKRGGKVKSASRRGDGIAQRGKTRA